MARTSALLISAFFAAAFSAAGQEPISGTQSRPDGDRSARKDTLSPEFENVRKALEALTPEQRKRFQENFLRWSNLPPEKKEALRDREEFRRKRMAEEIDVAIRDTGLELDKERRELFVKRYAEERRKVEEQLRKEWEEKRKPLLADLVARLKAEFTHSAPNPASR